MFKGFSSASISGWISAVKVLTAFLLSACTAFETQAADVQRSFTADLSSSADFSENRLFIDDRLELSTYERLFPESPEKNSARAKAVIDAPRTLIDGERREFSARLSGGEAATYEWSYEARGKVKTPAFLEFSAPTADTTQVTANWYARTGRSCAAEFSSAYTIRLRIKLRSGEEITELFPLTVEVPHNWGGFVDYPETTGAPAIAFDESHKIWVVSGAGTLQRTIRQPVIRAPETSQFYGKIKAHEDVHLRQMSEGIFADLFQIDSLMKQLEILSDADRQSLEQKVFQTIQQWRAMEIREASVRLPKAEKEAYAVSDRIAPRYLFNNCERFK